MSVKAVEVVIALVIGFQGGEVRLDKGWIDGLRAGDSGELFYLLSVNSREEFRFDQGQVSLTSCENFSCMATLPADLQTSTGYYVEFQVDPQRFRAQDYLPRLKEMVESGNLQGARLVAQRLRALIPDLPENIGFLEDPPPGQEPLGVPTEPEPDVSEAMNWLAQGFAALRQGRVAEARQRLAQIRESVPDLAGVNRLAAQITDFETRSQHMIFVSGGVHFIGRDSQGAKFFNQTPRFQTRLKSYWIDRSPVSGGDYSSQAKRQAGAFRNGGQSSPVVGLTFAEAEGYCRSLQKRLPTEFEWEVAATRSGWTVPSGLAEWTSSPYLPYPGNVEPEAEYHQDFKVVRGHSQSGPLDITQRFFLASDGRDLDVGFRCAVSGDEG